MTDDLLTRLPIETLKAERDKAAKVGDGAFVGRLDAALTAKGYVAGEPDPYIPGLTRRKVYLDSDGLQMRPAWVREGSDSLAWMAPFVLGGQRGLVDPAMVQAERRGGTVQSVFVPKGERATTTKI